ncbi:MAG: helix-turn-helix transcriptional regulator [Phycisphaerae bacterium]|nr:helix-turn-helix transcriptional regulator [Phycisphaerae bacterium]
MPPYFPTLDDQALARLRELVRDLHDSVSPAVPQDKLVELARNAPADLGITVDFEASRTLGQPMVVVRVPTPPPPDACLATLSARERDIVSLIAEGLSNKQIARRLHIALATVKDHVHRILDKAGLPNRAALTAAYLGRRQPS